MAKAEVVKKEITVTLTLNEDEALAVFALVGACPSREFYGVPATNAVFDALNKVLKTTSVDLWKYRVVDSEGRSISPKLVTRT